MKSQRFALLAAAFLLALLPLQEVRGGPADVEAVLRMMPADSPISAVVVDFTKLDKSISALVKTIKPDAPAPEIIAKLKEDLGIAEWIDFTKPVGVAQTTLQGGNSSVLWAVVPKFADKVKTVAGAKEEDGVWHMTFENKSDVFAKTRGDYVIASESKEGIALATKEGKSLADELKDRMDLLTHRDALIHVNFEPIRPLALGGIAQGAQYAPVLAMMVGGQAGADPMAMTAFFTGAFDGIKKFVEQVSYIDIAIGLTETAGNVTLATGYKDGAIKSYLAKQKPASAAPFTEVEDQPYFLAMSTHFPGGESLFTDYFFEMLTSSSAPPTGTPPAAGAADAAKEATKITRDLYRKVDGWNMVVSLSPSGMKTSGDYLGADATGILDLSKKTMTQVNPLTKSFNGGATYETLGSKKIGDVTVDQFAVKFDTTNPAAAQAAQMMGEKTRFSLGVVGGRVRYVMGDDQDAQKVFSGKIEKPLSGNKIVTDALAGLPAKRNAVMLIDPVGILPMVGPMMGMPKVEPMPPGPPVAVSVSLTGEPARVDIQVPIKSIERIVKAMTPQQPKTGT